MAMARRCLLAVACFIFLAIQEAGSVNPCHWNSCYFISTAEEGRSWDDNRNTCQGKGGDLVSIETLVEWQFING
ncbi:C-type lectin domain family 12 member B-like [Oculina patagonica]